MLAVLLASCAVPTLQPEAEAAVMPYKLGGRLYIQVYKDPNTMASALAHDHVIRAGSFTGKVNYDPANPAACTVEISLPVSSLVVDEKGLRETLGYTTFPTEFERDDIRAKMLSEDVLDAAKYPTISYKSTKCEELDGNVRVTGQMTMHGVSKTVVLPMTIKADEVNFSAKGAVKIKSSDFGMPPYSAGFGAVKNQDTMILVIDVTGAKGA